MFLAFLAQFFLQKCSAKVFVFPIFHPTKVKKLKT